MLRPLLLFRASGIAACLLLSVSLLLGALGPVDVSLAAPRAAPSTSPAPPQNVEVLSPVIGTVRSSTKGGLNTLTVDYRYKTPDPGPDPDSVVIQLVAPPDTAFYRFDDSGYAGDGSRTSRSLDLTTPNDGTSGTGLTGGQTYDIRLLAIDTAGDTTATVASNVLTIDNTAPSSVTVDAPSDQTFKRTDQTLDVDYSYQEAHPDSATIVFADGDGNTATFGVDDSGYAGDGTNKTVTLDLSSPKNDGGSGLTGGSTYDLTVTAIDSAGNSASSPTATNRLTIDETAPSVTAITRSNPTTETTSQSSVTFAVSFSEKINSLNTNDFTLGSNPSGASINGIDKSAPDTTVTVGNISGDGTLGLDVAPSTAQDPAGNGLKDTDPSTDETYTIDRTAPTVTAITRTLPTPTNADSVAFQVSFSETVTGLDGSDFTLSSAPDGSATITDISVSGDTTVAVESIEGDGTLGLSLADGNDVTDTAGNVLTDTAPSTDETYAIDNTAPTISTFTADGSSTSGIEVNVTADEDGTAYWVVVRDGSGAPSASQIKNGSNASGSAAQDGGSGSVTANTGKTFTASGLSDNTSYDVYAVVEDAVGNANTTAKAEATTLDGTGPSITGVSGPSADRYGIGATLTMTVSYDETVLVDESSGTPSIALDIGGTTRQATVQAGDGTQTLTFTYAVQKGDDDRDGIAFASTTIQLNGGALKDKAGNDAERNFSGSAPDLSGVTTDGTAPTVTSIVRSSPTAEETNQTSVDFAVRFSENVSGVDTGDFTLGRTPDGGASISNVSTSGDTTVTVDGISGTGALGLDLDDGTDIADNAGNTLDASEPKTDETYTIDTIAPALASGTVAGTNGYVDVSFSEGVYTNSDGSGVLQAGDLSYTFSQNGGSATDISIDDVIPPDGTTLSGGERTVRVQISVTEGPASGAETIEIQPSGSSAIYDEAGNPVQSGETTGPLSLTDRRPPSLGQLSLGVQGDNNLDLSFASTEPLSDLTVTVDGPDGYSKTFSRSQFAPSSINDDPFTKNFRLTATESYGGGGTYTATITEATDTVGNDGAPSNSTSYALPTAGNETLSTNEDNATSSKAPGLLGNDSPSPSDLTVEQVNGTNNVGSEISLPSDAQLTLNADGSYEYDPSGQFDDLGNAKGDTTDSFTYTVIDDEGGTSTATVSIDVDGVNDAPSISTSPGLIVSSIGGTAPLTTNEIDAPDPDNPDGEVEFTLTSTPNSGTLRKPGSRLTKEDTFTLADLKNDRVTYEHDGSSTKQDEFRFTVTDNSGFESSEKTLSIFINIDNEPPNTTADNGSTTEDAVLAVTDRTNGVLGNDADPDDDPLKVATVQGQNDLVGTEIRLSGGGRLQINEDGTYTFDPNGDFEALDPNDSKSLTVGYTASDGLENDDAVLTITVDGRNDAPTLTRNRTLTVDRAGGSARLTNVTLNASDADGDDGPAQLTYTLAAQPTSGTVTVNGAASTTFTQQALNNDNVAYTHAGGTAGTDSFSFDLSDDQGAGPSGRTATIEIETGNTPPNISDDRYVTDQGQPLSITTAANGVLANDSDPEDDPLQIGVTDSTDHGTVQLRAAGTFTYTPDPSFSGEDTFQYNARDGRAGVDTATVSIQVRPRQAAVAVNRTFPNPTDSTSFRLVALPGSAAVALESTLSGPQGDEWRAFRETGGSGSTASGIEPCSSGADCVLAPGTGYWVISRSPWSVSNSVETVSLDSTSASPVYRIPLQDGWNVISNPLRKDVDWSAVASANGGSVQNLYRFDGRWESTTTFASATSGEAYYFRDDDLDTLVVPYPGLKGTASSTTKTLSKETTSGHALTLHAVRDGDTLSTIRAGRRPGSKKGFDATDRYGPPGYFGTAALRLAPPGDGQSPALRTEYRPLNGDGSAFNVRLQTSSDQPLTLVAQGTDAFESHRVSLVRTASGRSHDLKADSVTSLAPSSSTTRLQLLIGSAAFVDDAQQAAVPDDVTLLPNYPNPFRRTTTLEYTLPRTQEVRIAIYDVLGRRVQTVVHGRREAGFHALQWDGGRSLASGTYFARLVAGSTTRTERLVIVR